ncbi:MAG: IreB family regulatory phosphoprotein [Oscillospiraceae bacterium]|nr:IreB family regulatory phosphoprotein [Oscillospiraceae bacterium]
MSDEERAKLKEAILLVYDAMEEKGYNAIDQFVGYLASGDPSYVTNNRNARNVLMKLDRDDVLEELLRTYIGNAR